MAEEEAAVAAEPEVATQAQAQGDDEAAAGPLDAEAAAAAEKDEEAEAEEDVEVAAAAEEADEEEEEAAPVPAKPVKKGGFQIPVAQPGKAQSAALARVTPNAKVRSYRNPLSPLPPSCRPHRLFISDARPYCPQSFCRPFIPDARPSHPSRV